jgi:hypothetical protein
MFETLFHFLFSFSQRITAILSALPKIFAQTGHLNITVVPLGYNDKNNMDKLGSFVCKAYKLLPYLTN